MAVSVASLAQAVFARAAAADAPVFTPGQLLEALVLGKLPDGMTALRIGEIVVSAQLPPGLPAGTILQLQVTSGGAAPQLAIMGQPQLPLVPPAAPMPVAPGEMPVLLLAAEVAPRAMASAPGATTPVMSTPSMPAPIQPNATPPMGAQQQMPATSPQVVPPAPGATAAAASAQAAVPQATVGPATAAPTAVGTGGSNLPLPNIESPQPVAARSARIESTTPGAAMTPATPSPGAATAPSTTAIPQANLAAPAAAPATVVVPGVSSGMAEPVPASVPQQSASVVSATRAPVTSASMPATPTVSSPAIAPALAGMAAVGSAAAAASEPAPAMQANVPLPVPPSPGQPAAQASAAATSAAIGTPGQNAPVVPPTTSLPVPPEAEAANPLLLAQSSARPVASMADLPRAPAPPAAPTLAATAPSQPATPQAALAQMVPEALAKQNSMAPLLAALASVVGRSAALPEPVVRAALQVLAQRIALPAGGPNAAGLEAAIAKSGIYLEAGLAKGAAPPGDMKAALAGLKGALGAWLGGNPAPVQAAHQAAPPLRGMPPRAEMAEPPPVLPDMPRDIGRALHSQADAALSRIKLSQFASLPDADPVRGPGPELRMEVPFLLGSELVMAQFQIFRDGARQKAERKRGWTMRFAMNFAGAGEVGAEIGLLGKAVSVALWAAEREMAERLNAALPELAPALAALGLDAGAIRVRNLPPEAERPASGHFLDSVT